MPADNGLHRMSTEDLAAFRRGLRALRVREGLSLNGPDPQAGPPRHGPRRNRWRPSPGLVGVTATAIVLAGLAAGGAVLVQPTGPSESSAPSAPLPGGGRSMANRGG